MSSILPDDPDDQPDPDWWDQDGLIAGHRPDCAGWPPDFDGCTCGFLGVVTT